MTAIGRLIAVTGLAIAQLAWGVGDPLAMSRAEFDELMQEISNWGRWVQMISLAH